MRGRLKVCLAVVLALVCGWTLAKAGAFSSPEAPATKPVAEVKKDDAGDDQATTTFDGPMVRQRAAIAVHVTGTADRALIARQMRAAATKQKIAGLTDATFAVFSKEMLDYLVPEMTLVLPEGANTYDGEVLMRDHAFPGVSYYLVRNVLVHDLTFAVIPNGVTPEKAVATEDAEGVLADSLGRYTTAVQQSGLTVKYFGAILSDGEIQVVRAAMARAANVQPDQVAVAASSPGAGVDLTQGVPDLSDDLAGKHQHG
jgi:hypothetical protein